MFGLDQVHICALNIEKINKKILKSSVCICKIIHWQIMMMTMMMEDLVVGKQLSQ